MHVLNSFFGNQGGPGPTPSTGRYYFLRRTPFEMYWIFLIIGVNFLV